MTFIGLIIHGKNTTKWVEQQTKFVDDEIDDKADNTSNANNNKEAKVDETKTRGTEGRQQMRLQWELYQLHTLYNPTIPEEEKAKIICMSLMDLAFSSSLENEGDKIPSMFQEVWWNPSPPKCEKWQKAIPHEFQTMIRLGV